MNCEEFKFNISSLLKTRKIGVSGLMRVKNEAEFLSLSIDSCIDALDELIIVYQESEDSTAQVLLEKEKQYPNKVKVFFYEPEILSHNLSDEEFEKINNLPQDSIHLLSNYYNYTLAKANFQFAMKIDADQIYNTRKLQMICDAYRASNRIELTFLERWIYHVINVWSFVINKISSRLKYKLSIFPPKSWTKIYYNCCLKKIQNDKIIASVSGLNLYIKNNNVFLPLGTYTNDTFPPFNGIDDHLIFKISEHTFYEPAPLKTSHASYMNCVIEKFNWKDPNKESRYSDSLVNLGFLWFHVAPLKNKYYERTKHLYKEKLVEINSAKLRNLKDTLSCSLLADHWFWFNFWWKGWRLQAKNINDNWKSLLDRIIQTLYVNSSIKTNN